MDDKLNFVLAVVNERIEKFQNSKDILYKVLIPKYTDIVKMIEQYKKQKELGMNITTLYTQIVNVLNENSLGFLISSDTSSKEDIDVNENNENEDEIEEDYTLKPKSSKVTTSKSNIEKSTEYVIKWINMLQFESKETTKVVEIYEEIKEYYINNSLKENVVYDINQHDFIIKNLKIMDLRNQMRVQSGKDKLKCKWNEYLSHLPYFYCRLTGHRPVKLATCYLDLLIKMCADFTKYCNRDKKKKRMHLGFMIKKILEFIGSEFSEDFSSIYELIPDQTIDTQTNNENVWRSYVLSSEFAKFKKENYEKKTINDEEISSEENVENLEIIDEDEDEFVMETVSLYK